MCIKTSTLPELSKKTTATVADVFRQYGDAYRQTHCLVSEQYQAMDAIERCRTELLGGHIACCDQCGAITIRYNSCHNRHCPTCQTATQIAWLEKEQSCLLPIPYFHTVFTLPHDLNPIAQAHPKIIYNLLFKAASETLKGFGKNEKWLGGEIGITMVLHTWGQNLGQHIHVHCIVTGGALTADKQAFIKNKGQYLFPVKALSKVFRAKYITGLKKAYNDQQFHFTGQQSHLNDSFAWNQLIHRLFQHQWVVYAKKPFAGPKQVLDYVSRYTHRVAISNHRILKIEDGKVHFLWKDYSDDNKKKILILDADEFIRRFLLHVLPKRFMKIRHYGFLANRHRQEKLSICRTLLGQPDPEPKDPEPIEDFIFRTTGIDITLCPHCHQGKLQIIDTIAIPLAKSTGPP